MSITSAPVGISHGSRRTRISSPPAIEADSNLDSPAALANSTKSNNTVIEIPPVTIGEKLHIKRGTYLETRYLINSLLGEGGMGKAFLADDLTEERLVVVKTLHSGRYDSSYRERFLREVDAQSRIIHPNVVRILNSGEDNGKPFFVMEYVNGSTLKDLIEEVHTKNTPKNFPLETMLKIAINILEGLQVAHDIGIIHRDIKPANIFIDRAGTPKLADFGLAKYDGATTITETGVITGTPDYTAPERCDGNTGDLRSDIYSVGVMLYEMITLTNGSPFHVAGGKVIQTIGRQRNYIPPLPSTINPSIPAFLDTIVMKALAKNPEGRFRSAKELADHLREVIDPRNLSSPTTKPSNSSSPVTNFSAV